MCENYEIEIHKAKITLRGQEIEKLKAHIAALEHEIAEKDAQLVAVQAAAVDIIERRKPMWIEREKLEKLRDEMTKYVGDPAMLHFYRQLEALLDSPEPQVVEFDAIDCNAHNTFCLSHVMKHMPITQAFLSTFGIKFGERWRIMALKIAEPERTWRVIKRYVSTRSFDMCERCGSTSLLRSNNVSFQCTDCNVLLSGETTWEEWMEEK